MAISPWRLRGMRNHVHSGYAWTLSSNAHHVEVSEETVTS